MSVPSTPKSFSLFPKGLQWALQVIHFFSERLTLSLLYRLFFYPRPYALPERERPYAAKWANEIVETPWGKLPIAHAPSASVDNRGKILVFHGWSGRPTQLGGVVDALNAHGFDCTVITAPGHVPGRTQASSLRDFAQYAAWLNQRYGPFFAGIGHSLGGAALLLSVEHGAHWERLVSISAFGNTERVFEEFIQQSGLPNRYVSLLLDRVARKLGSDPRYYSPDRVEYSGSLLILHAPDDLEVPISDAELLHKAHPNSQCIRTSPLGHRKILWRPETWDAILRYLKQ